MERRGATAWKMQDTVRHGVEAAGWRPHGGSASAWTPSTYSNASGGGRGDNKLPAKQGRGSKSSRSTASTQKTLVRPPHADGPETGRKGKEATGVPEVVGTLVPLRTDQKCTRLQVESRGNRWFKPTCHMTVVRRDISITPAAAGGGATECPGRPKATYLSNGGKKRGQTRLLGRSTRCAAYRDRDSPRRSPRPAATR